MAATNLNLAAAPGTGPVPNTLRDIKPPVEIPSGWLWVWGILGAFVLALAVFFLWKYLRKRREQEALIPEIPPHVRARQRLEEALGLIGQPREFCIAVSDAIRAYLEERFRFHAPDRTTEEFLHELRSTQKLLPDQKESLGEFLQRCDLVKFARYEPREPELLDLHASALRLVEETEPTPVPSADSPDTPALAAEIPSSSDAAIT